MNRSAQSNDIRPLDLAEIDAVSGGKGKTKKIVGVITERCESRFEGEKKISVCTTVN